MQFKFPLPDVIIQLVKSSQKVDHPVLTDTLWQINQDEFAMQVNNIADFYVSNGNYIEFAPVPGADPDWVNLYLNGQVLVALLHQRKIINFHASSFIHKGQGIMLLGETGAGKSSLTVVSTLNGATFISDDLTPVVIRNGKPLMWPVYRTIKLRENTIDQLRIRHSRLQKAEKGTGKYFFHVDKANVVDYPLHYIVKIEVGETSVPAFYEPDPTEKFSLLRSEICSWEMLSGMPETEIAYLQQLVNIVTQVKMTRILRPREIDIKELHQAIAGYLDAE